MIDVVRLVIFTVVAIGAIINIYIELKNLKKYILNRFLSVLLIGSSGLIKNILSQLYNRLIKNQPPVNNVSNMIVSLHSPFGEEQLAFANCSFI
ncbi:hypothetical protein G5716_03570 [Bacillus pacificus]|nr:hypothetical protein [Bacillus pacificus]